MQDENLSLTQRQNSGALQSPLTRAVTFFGLAALLGSVLAAANGFARYEHLQGAVALPLISVALLLSALVAARGGIRELGSRWLAPGLLVLLAWMGARVAMDGSAHAADALVPLVLLAGGALAARHVRGLRSVVALCAVLAGGVSAAQWLGLSFPELIPHVTLPLAGRSFFDHPGVAAAWFLLALFLLMDRNSAPRALRVAGLVGAVGGLMLTQNLRFIGLAAILMWPGVVISSGPTRKRLFAAYGALLAGVVAVALLLPGTTVPELRELGLRLPNTALVTGSVPIVRVPGERGFLFQTGLSYAARQPLTGHGPGAFAGHWPASANPNSEFALQFTSGLPAWEHANSGLLEMAGDMGIPFALLLLALLLLPLGRAWKSENGLGFALGLAAPAVFAFSGSWQVAPVALLLGFTLGEALGAVRGEAREPNDNAKPASSAESLARLASLGGALAGAALLLHVFKTLAWSYTFAASLVFLGHSRLTEGELRTQAAAEIQERFASEFNAATLAYLRRGGALDEAEEHYRRAVELRPQSVQARLAEIDLFTRRSFASEDRDERFASSRARLGELVELDPNYLSLVIQRANTAMAVHDVATAVASLEAYAIRPIDEYPRIIALKRLAEIHQDVSDPEAAESAYRRAAALAPEGPPRDVLLLEAARMQEWAETGSRPRDDGHGH